MDDKTHSPHFPSVAALLEAHAELLQQRQDSEDTAELLAEIEIFIREGKDIGAFLDSRDDRRICQNILDYWANTLYSIQRGEYEPPDATLVDFDPSLAPELSEDLCPYLGLDAFQERNQELFFGRQRLIEKLIDQLKSNRLLPIVGSSGSGKSSLMLAGLLPALKAEALSGSQDWHIYPPLAPGSDPLESLAQAIRPPDAEADWVRHQVEGFRQDPNHLARLIAGSNYPMVVLVIDQFEELFTLCEKEAIRQAFANNLLGLLRVPDARHTVILTLRTDFIDRIAKLPELQPPSMPSSYEKPLKSLLRR
jgi:hypothetical protein